MIHCDSILIAHEYTNFDAACELTRVDRAKSEPAAAALEKRLRNFKRGNLRLASHSDELTFPTLHHPVPTACSQDIAVDYQVAESNNDGRSEPKEYGV
jgi:hypothetical protein